MKIGRQIRLARIDRKLTQLQLAELLGVTRWWVNRVEAGRIRLKKFAQVGILTTIRNRR